MENALQALTITVAGMGLVFFALAIVMVAIVGLDRLFPGEAPAPAGPDKTAAPAAPASRRLQAVVGGKTVLVEAREGGDKVRRFAVADRVFSVERSRSATGELLIDGEPYRVEVLSVEGDIARVRVAGQTLEVKLAEAAPEAARMPDGPGVAASAAAGAPAPAAPAAPAGAAVGQAMPAPLPGKVLRVAVAVGEIVKPGQELCVLEAMKMENTIRAQAAGVVRQVAVRPGQSVSPGDPLMWIE